MRRLVLLVGSMALLATLGPAGITSAAVPKCDGKPATHVGTNGPNRIIGTRGPDVIVAKGGKDTIKGRGGHDRICGGNGNDTIDAGRGNDRVFGGSGNDFMKGGAGDDRMFGFDGNDGIFGEGGNDHMDGGDGSDLCDQGAGSGTFSRCEEADLGVDVESPPTTSEENITFTVEVTNFGPDDVPYNIIIDVDSPDLDCGSYPWEGGTLEPVLPKDETRSQQFPVFCENPHGSDPHVKLFALVQPFATDPDFADNSDESETHVNEEP
jgi:hypothetical protein